MHDRNHPSDRLRLAGIAALCLLLATVGRPSPAQGELSVRAYASSERVRVGEAFTLGIEAKGSQSVPAPALANLEGFQARYIGPSTQVAIVNGQVSASVEHRFALTAQREGEFVLGPFTVAHAGQTYETNSVRVVVGAGTDTADVGGEALRLVLSIPRHRVYLHERIVVDVLLYVGDVTARDVHFPTLQTSGMSIEGFGQPSRATQMIDGRRYEVLRFRGAAVPVQTGTRPFGPATLNLNLVQQQRNFFFAQRQAVELRSEAIDLEVVPLPAQGRPDDFAGAVGRFALEVSASPTTVDAGDPVTVRITVRGDGNFANLAPPAFAEADGLRVYAPQLVESGEAGVRVYEQVVIPEGTQIDALPGLRLPYFDPDAERYAVAQTAPIPLHVRDSGRASGVAEALGAPGGVVRPESRQAPLGRDIVYIKDEPGQLLHERERRARWWWLLAWQPVPVLFYIIVLLYDRHRRRLTSDERYARSTRAGRAVRRRFGEAEAALAAGDTARFFDELEGGLREYLSARLGVPRGAVDVERVRSAGVGETEGASIASIFAACEQVRFAPVSAAAQPQELLAAARAVVVTLERKRGWLFG